MPLAENKKKVTISLKKDQVQVLEKEAKERGLTKSAIIMLALEQYMRDQKR